MTKKSQAKWQKPQFWRNLFLYFWCFSFIGHIGELIWGLLMVALDLRSWQSFLTIPLVSIAVPYGLGAVALLLLVYPLVQKKRLNLIATFLLGAVVTTAIEFVCAALVVAFTGSNPFWNYSERFMNLFGWVCLGNGLVFGLGSTVALRWVFPFTEKILSRVKERRLNIAFWILFVGYVLSQIYLRIIKS